ncbi:MAG: 3-oxoacyl-[ACP] synthase [Myxococcaceae bacterium]|nr:3-oxoacyl-[ACP] synthase [Myxococcaceae bacterium]
MGVTSALGDDCDTTFKALLRGLPVVSPAPFELPFHTVTGLVAGALEPLPSAFRAYDTRLARIALRALGQVRAQVERARSRYGRERVGVLVGTSTGGLDATEPAYRLYRATDRHSPEFSLRRSHAFDALAVLLRDVLDLTGPTYAVSTACTSSAKALASAHRLIGAGLCDAVLVAGVDAVCETTLRGFHSLGVLSTQAARPFCSQRDGIHIGEGAGLLLIERNGEGPVCLAAVGESSDAHSMSAPQPEGLGATEAILRGLRQANLDPSQVDYVNAHGTGTLQNDIAESRAIRRALPPGVAVSSTKGLTGHTLGACGTLEALFAALSVAHGELPPSAGCSPLDTGIDLHVLLQPVRQRVRVALSNALAFGGSNASVVLTAS